VSSWMACTSADRVTAPGKCACVQVQDCRQNYCSRQVHRSSGTGLQTGPLLQASTQECQYRAADRVSATCKYTRRYNSRTVHYHINQEYTCDKPQPIFQLNWWRLLV
jgi:hypothetical protein